MAGRLEAGLVIRIKTRIRIRVRSRSAVKRIKGECHRGGTPQLCLKSVNVILNKSKCN